MCILYMYNILLHNSLLHVCIYSPYGIVYDKFSCILCVLSRVDTLDTVYTMQEMKYIIWLYIIWLIHTTTCVLVASCVCNVLLRMCFI